MHQLKIFRTVLPAALLAACASYGPGDVRVGDDEAAVVKSMGPPSARYALPAGAARLAYARGPYGQHTFMVDVGADGRVVGVRQVLGEKQFAEIPLGMPEAELLLTLGPPADRRLVGLKPGWLWSYRYPNTDCLWYQFTMSSLLRVQGGGYAIDPVCDEARKPG